MRASLRLAWFGDLRRSSVRSTRLCVSAPRHLIIRFRTSALASPGLRFTSWLCVTPPRSRHVCRWTSASPGPGLRAAGHPSRLSAQRRNCRRPTAAGAVVQRLPVCSAVHVGAADRGRFGIFLVQAFSYYEAVHHGRKDHWLDVTLVVATAVGSTVTAGLEIGELWRVMMTGCAEIHAAGLTVQLRRPEFRYPSHPTVGRDHFRADFHQLLCVRRGRHVAEVAQST